MLRFLILLPLLLTSCGPTSKSTLHSSKEWKAFKKNSTPLPSVTLKKGIITDAYKYRTGFPPMFGGYIPSLVAEDPEIVKANTSSTSGGFDTSLIGQNPGTTRIFQANGMVKPEHQRVNLNPRAFLYTVRVEE